MYTGKGYVGGEEKLKQYFTEYVFEGKPRVLSAGERSRLLLTGVLLLRADEYVLCGLYEGALKQDAEILDTILTELSLNGNLHIGYIGGTVPTNICGEIHYL